jgi:hypothetical protein
MAEPLNPLVFGVTALNFALFLHALICLGYDSKPPAEGAPSPWKSLGATGSLIGFIGLVAMAWLNISANPSGNPILSMMFTTIPAMYGFLWLGLAIIEFFDLDFRWAGNAALLCAIMQIVDLIIMHALWPAVLDLIVIEIVLWDYVLVTIGFWAATHGKMSLKLQGWNLLVCFVLNSVLLYYSSGLATTSPFA